MRMTRLLSVLLCICGLAAPLAARTTPLKGTPPGQLIALAKKSQRIRVIVGVRDDAWRPEGTLRKADVPIQRARGKARVAEVLRAHPNVVVPGWQFEVVPGFVAEVNEAALRRLLDDDRVSSVEEDAEIEFTLNLSVPNIGAKAVHDRQPSIKGAGQIVVVIDNGVDHTHPFLGNRVRREDGACFSGATMPGGNDSPVFDFETVCPNGLTQQIGFDAGVPCNVGNLTLSNNPCHHGTRVAGVIAGDRVVGDSDPSRNTESTGVAPAAEIIPIQIASKECTSSGCAPKGYKSSVIKALEYVAMTLHPVHGRKLAAVNLSLAFGLVEGSRTDCDNHNLLMGDYVEDVHSLDIAVVAATANDTARNGARAPGCLPFVISVSATDDGDNVPAYANVADFIDLFAPGGADGAGVGILTSRNLCTDCAPYVEDHGTSLAAPHVSGAIALLREKTPSATVAKLLADLAASPRRVSDQRVDGTVTNKPRIKIDHAIDLAVPPGPPTAFSAKGTAIDATLLTWTAPDPPPTGAKYRIRVRTQKSGAWTLVADDVTGTSYPHTTGLTRGTMYEYELVTKDSSGAFSIEVLDYAITRPFTPIGSPAYVAGLYIGELREAVDAWRGFADGTLADAFDSSYVAATGYITPGSFTQLVTALDEARAYVGRPDFAYVGLPPPATGMKIDRRYVEQLRTAME
jgi:subtilisin